MIRRILVAPTSRIRHIGILDLGEFYRWIKRWLEFNGFWEDMNEKQYLETILATGAKRIEFTWECRRRKTPDFTYYVPITFELVGISDVEVQRGDKKIKLQRGDFDIRLSAHLEKTRVEEGFITVLRDLYERYIIKKRIEEYKLDLYDKFYKLVEEMKEFINVYV